ncbi:hypothetical protein ACFT0E_29430, partial [Streptomyces sp. NPDC057052]
MAHTPLKTVARGSGAHRAVAHSPLENRTVVVTGAARGVGAAQARALARRGAGGGRGGPRGGVSLG